MKKNKDSLERILSDQKNLTELLDVFQKSSDFKSNTLSISSQELHLYYYNTLVDKQRLDQFLIRELQQSACPDLKEIGDIKALIPVDEIEITDKLEIILPKLLKGHVLIRLGENDDCCALVHLPNNTGKRTSNDTENEFSVVGPKVGFIEDLDTNIHLLRLQLNIPDLVVKEFIIGSVSRTRVAMLYIEGVTNKEVVDRLEHRLTEVDFDVIFDSLLLDQFISDNSNTPFPLFLSTERRDRVVYALLNGQVAFVSDGSSYFSTGPSTLFDFFISPEDYYLPWILGTFFRMIRIFGVVFSLFASALYVAVMTYHYEVVPRNLLGPLVFSRSNVPFNPVLEVLFLETTIEFLREAGARLPSKIGQTLGIVGGIIVGQAAVEAALTSNVLIIIVSLSALASFTTPIYRMSNTIRFLRFPIILLSAIWGAFGILLGVCFLIVHLTRLKSLGFPYMAPMYPLEPKDLREGFIRLPYQVSYRRPSYLRPDSMVRYTPKAVKPSFQDWDED